MKRATKLDVIAWLRVYLADGAWHDLPALREAAKQRGFSMSATQRALNETCEARPLRKNLWGCRLLGGAK